MLTAKEYIELYQSSNVNDWIEKVFPSVVNGEFTIDGNEWFPCVILKEDIPSEDVVYIVTRNQTFMHEQRNKVMAYENPLSEE